MSQVRIFVAREFSRTPGPRSSDEGEFSGEEFLEKLLLPRFDDASSRGARLFIDLDGAEGYATSFLEAAFGGLARKRDPEAILRTLDFKSEEEPYLIDEIKQYILEARER